MGKKVKSKECSGRWCERHLFSIHPYFFKNSHSKEETIRLCPRFNKDRKEFESALPEVNHDRKCYTPLFILQEDKRLYCDNDGRSRQNFEENQLEQEYEISEIMVPKVSSEKRYCKVCRDDYSDYLQHIDSQPHRANIAKNSYSAYIVELEHYLKPTHSKQKQSLTLQPPSNSHPETFLDSEIETLIAERETQPKIYESIAEKPQEEVQLS